MASVLVLYHSQEHGNTKAMAEALAAGARLAGAAVSLMNTNEGRLDIERFRLSDAVAFGTPDYYSYLAGGLKVFLDDWHIAKMAKPEGLTGKPYGLFYSHGGGGAVRGPLIKLFQGIGTLVGDVVESKGAPDQKALDACGKLGRDIAAAAAK
jgi:NAD(P)H dehydrogenase (quinone)